MRGRRGKGQISKGLPTVSIKEIVQWPELNSVLLTFQSSQEKHIRTYGEG